MFSGATFGDAVGAPLGVSLALGAAVDVPVAGAVGVGVAGDSDEVGGVEDTADQSLHSDGACAPTRGDAFDHG